MSDGRSADVVIVGGGVVGVCVAHYLVARGASVTVLDGNDRVGAGCSYGNAGLIAPSHCMPLARPHQLRRIPSWLRAGGPIHIRPRVSAELLDFGQALVRSSRPNRVLGALRVLRDNARGSRDLFGELAAELDFGYRADGLMNVCLTRTGFDEFVRDAHLLEREGFQPEVLSPDEACRREPSLRPEIAGAVYFGEDAHCDPGRFVQAVAAAAESAGVRFQLGMSVNSFRRSLDGAIATVETDRGSFRGATVVLAAGAWTSRLTRVLGHRLPLQPGTGYHLHTTGTSSRIGLPLIFHEHVATITPIDGDLRITGMMDFVGLEPAPYDERVVQLRANTEQYVDGLDEARRASTWRGSRPCTPDSLPIVGRSSRITNLIYATGHGMLGLTLGPITGLAVADLVGARPSSVDLTPMSPARFGV